MAPPLPRRRPANRGFNLSDQYEYSGRYNGLVLSDDGARLAIYKNARTVTITDARKFTALGDVVLPGPTDTVHGMGISPNGHGLALLVRRGGVSTARELQFWDLKTLRQIRTVPLDSTTYFDGRILFRPDGKAVMTDGMTGLIEYPSGRVLAKSGDITLRTVLAFSRDGRTIVSADGLKTDQTVLLTDARTLRSKGLIMRGHRDYVKAAAFSPNGTLLATGDGSGVIRLWEVASGRPYALPLTGHQTKIWSLAFAPDGRTLHSVSESGTILTHELAPSLTAAALCKSTNGGLTPREWKATLPALDYRVTCPAQ